MKIAIGCDPNAENEKQALMKFIENKGLGKVTDFGSTDPIYANQLKLEKLLLQKNMTEVFFCVEQDLGCL